MSNKLSPPMDSASSSVTDTDIGSHKIPAYYASIIHLVNLRFYTIKKSSVRTMFSSANTQLV